MFAADLVFSSFREPRCNFECLRLNFFALGNNHFFQKNNNVFNEYFVKISELDIELNVFLKLIVCTKNINMDHIFNSKDATMSKLYIMRHDICQNFFTSRLWAYHISSERG